MAKKIEIKTKKSLKNIPKDIRILIEKIIVEDKELFKRLAK